MSTASNAKLFLLFTIILLMLVVTNSEARSYSGITTVTKKINSRTFLEKLGYDVPKIAYYRRVLGSDPQRISPGGPDPQHHYQPPASVQMSGIAECCLRDLLLSLPNKPQERGYIQFFARFGFECSMKNKFIFLIVCESWSFETF